MTVSRRALAPILTLPWLAAMAAPARWPLWVVERNGAKVYLLGETPPREKDWSQPDIEALAAGCDVFWTETNHNVRGDVNALLAQYGLDKTPLSDRLNKADMERVSLAAEKAKTPLSALAQFRPWLVAQSLEGPTYVAEGRTGKAAQTVITDRAKAAGRPVKSEFPYLDDTAAWFGALTPAQDVQYLRYTLDQLLAPDADNARLDAWSRGDLAPAAAFVEHLRNDYPEFYAVAVVARNRGWIARVNEMLTSNRATFVVVGLYHLAGPDSVPVQLKTAGLNGRRLA
ncbi:MAG TPA: TraB/GumN family protein [Caulobacteraceae bacterium]|jgi:uncharacterized protein YbaP (TraB family)